MFETLRNAWKIKDLRQKIIFTICIILIIRVGVGLLIPFLDPSAVKGYLNTDSAFATMNMITGGSLGQTTVFALGVQPYINASIIIQLLSIVFPQLEQLSKQGEEGKKKKEMITRLSTIGIALLQSIAYYMYMVNNKLVVQYGGFQQALLGTAIVGILMAGTCLVVWLGEEINIKGIGNGISMVIFAGILSNFPAMFYELYAYFRMGLTAKSARWIAGAPILFILYIVMIVFIVFMTNAERKIPVQYAKRVVGRKMYGGQSTYIPIKVNMSGVMPVIFASSIMQIPQLLTLFINPNNKPDGFFAKFVSFFSARSIAYAIFYFILVFAFNFFNTAMNYNPVEIANDLRKNSGAIPGFRPGKPTSDYLNLVVTKINVVGGLFLSLVATLPIFIGLIFGMNFSMAGTSVIIVVGVALDTVKAMESQMMMRHYKGFLE